MRFEHPGLGFRFDPDSPDQPAEGLSSGRRNLRIVAALVVVFVVVLLGVGRTDVAGGVAVMILAPLAVVMLVVEAAAASNDHNW